MSNCSDFRVIEIHITTTLAFVSLTNLNNKINSKTLPREIHKKPTNTLRIRIKTKAFFPEKTAEQIVALEISFKKGICKSETTAFGAKMRNLSICTRIVKLLTTM